MTRSQRGAWWGLVAISAIVVVFGALDIASGVEADPGITLGLTGLTTAGLAAESAAGYRLVDFGARAGGLHLVVMGLLFLAVLAAGYRRGDRWAWWAMWLLPAWAFGVAAMHLAFGVAEGQVPPPPMISGPIVGVIAVVLLVVSRPRLVAGDGR